MIKIFKISLWFLLLYPAIALYVALCASIWITIIKMVVLLISKTDAIPI